MKTVWRGRYLDGRSSASQRAALQTLKAGLKITLARGKSFLWPYDEIRQTQGVYAGDPVRLERGEGIAEVVIIDDTDFLYSLRAKATGHKLRFHNPGFRATRAWLTLYAGLATLAFALAFHEWGIPFLADTLAPRVPVSWETGLGKSELNLMAPAANRVENPRLDQALQQIVDRLAGTLPHCPYSFHVTVSDAEVVNAFALPGGNIVVFRGLLQATRTPEELAGVLAHEMQHILRKHTTKRIIQQSSTGLLISAMAGDVTGSMAFALQSARTLSLLEYSRGEEEEADREGMKLLLSARINPQGMIRFFETLKEKGKTPQFLKFVSSHPATEDRIEKLKAIVASEKKRPSSIPLLPGINWAGLMKKLGH
jgi:Zn-dependent protease with chaperone function